MDFSWILTSRRVWTVILSPVIAWALMKWQTAVDAAVLVCTMATSTDAGALTHDCTPTEAREFVIKWAPFAALAVVALFMKHGQLTLSKSKAQAATPDSESGANQP